MSSTIDPSQSPKPAGAIRAVTVYCSSSNGLHPDYHSVAQEFATALAASGRTLVYGGGCVGLMGEIARTVRDEGGHVVGIITERLKDAEQLDDLNDENIIVQTMRQRKALLEERGDAFVVLPGGVGTLEEFFEILVGRLLGEHDKPILMLNCNDPDDNSAESDRYFDPLLKMFDHVIGSRFARSAVLELFDVCATPEELMSALAAHERSPSEASHTQDDLLPGRHG